MTDEWPSNVATGPRDDAPRMVVDLADRSAADAGVVGAKAANLAHCASHGVPTLPGFVLTTSAVSMLDGGRPRGDVAAALAAAWTELSRHHDGPVIVRSSSTAEDLTESSMAGQFVSVLDVHDRDQLFDAVRTVARSAEAGAAGERTPLPMAVLVQPQLDVAMGGVLFGADPVTGDRRHVVAEVVPARVDDLVSGVATAAHYVLSRRGRVVERSNVSAAPRLSLRLRRRLVRLSCAAERAAGAAQDVEWAVDRGGRLWLLQSRPITAIAERPVSDRLFGPGPVAETFPLALRTLEEDLWLQPLRQGIERALRATAAVSEQELSVSPIVFAVDGRPAIDLGLTGIATGRPSVRQRVDPRRIVRRLATAWRVGRLRVAFPRLAEDVVETVDADLRAIPSIEELDDEIVVELLERARRELATVHQYEVLAGMLLRHGRTGEQIGASASMVGLAALDEAGRHGWSEAEAIERAPVLLALTPPSWSEPALPPSNGAGAADTRPLGPLGPREALRLRSRWLQELLTVSARSLGGRLVRAGVITRADLVRELTVDELAGVVASGVAPDDLEERSSAPSGPPLPARFRLGPSGTILAVHEHQDGDHPAAGMPAVAGRAAGTARHRLAPGTKKAGHVLVVEHLEPSLAPLLPSLDALVSETGSALSHLAILAREVGVPTVVGVPDARVRFPPGTRLLVDGAAGDVQVLPHEADDPRIAHQSEVPS